MRGWDAAKLEIYNYKIGPNNTMKIVLLLIDFLYSFVAFILKCNEYISLAPHLVPT